MTGPARQGSPRLAQVQPVRESGKTAALEGFWLGMRHMIVLGGL